MIDYFKRSIDCGIFAFALLLVVTGCQGNKEGDAWSDIQARFEKTRPDLIKGIAFDHSLETDNSFLIDNGGTVYYAKNNNGLYQIMSYEVETRKHASFLTDGNSNISKPFLFGKTVSALQEIGSSGKYQIADEKLRLIIGQEPVDRLFFSREGKSIIVKFLDSDELIFVEADTGLKRSIVTLGGRVLHGIVFSDHKNGIVSLDDELYWYHFDTNSIERIETGLSGPKLNPYFYEDYLYFSSNSQGNFYHIYECNLSAKHTKRIITASSDLRLPKRFLNCIYYLEVKNSEYLLKYFDIATGKTGAITDKGVTYNYEVDGVNIFYTYSDQNIARCLKKYQIDSDRSTPINCEEADMAIKMSFENNPPTSPAYLIGPPNETNIKGVILYFHPGRNNDDYSPRWDNMIMPFAHSGYVVVAPNFPGSSGYGKSHTSKNLQDAILDLNKWKQKLRQSYPDKPLFFYGISSGSVLMEATIQFDDREISGIISAFGFSFKGLNKDVPTLYILGEDDPLISFNRRSHQISELAENGRKVLILNLPREAHWIQRPESFLRYYERTLSFLDAVSPLNY